MKIYSDITSLADLTDAVYELHNQAGHYNVWWRGQDADWPLVPRVFRGNHHPAYEAQIVRKFRHQALSRHGSCPDWRDLPSWFFLMQHHRLPTRLLDWSKAPLKALFFSVRDSEADEAPGVLWGLEPYIMSEALSTSGGPEFPHHEPVIEQLQDATTENSDHSDTVVPIRPTETDLRLMIQKSRFTAHGSDTPLEDREGAPQYLVKMVIPASAKVRIRSELSLHRIRERDLFPDLEHLADDLEAFDPFVGFNKPGRRWLRTSDE